MRKQNTSSVVAEVDFSRGNGYIESSPLALISSHQQFPFWPFNTSIQMMVHTLKMLKM